MLGGKAQAAPAAEWTGFLDGDDVNWAIAQLFEKEAALSCRTAYEHSLHAGLGEERDLIRNKGLPGDRDKRLRLPPRSITEALRSSTGEDDRLRQRLTRKPDLSPGCWIVAARRTRVWVGAPAAQECHAAESQGIRARAARPSR
jgi:hypothetical protein